MKPTLLKEGLLRAIAILFAVIILVLVIFLARYLYNAIFVRSQPSQKLIQSQTIQFDLQGWEKVKENLK